MAVCKCWWWRPWASWQTKIGAEATRAEPSQIYGDQGTSGIQKPTTSKNIFVYSDPARGQQHGYAFNGWNSDGSIFRYAGAGPVGGQVLLRGNKAVANQPTSGLPVRFMADIYRSWGNRTYNARSNEFQGAEKCCTSSRGGFCDRRA